MPIADDEFVALLSGFLGQGLRRAAKVLGTMLGSAVGLAMPELDLIAARDLRGRVALGLGGSAECRLSAVEMRYSGPVRGTAELVFPRAQAERLTALAVFGPAPGVSPEELKAATLAEIGNVVINAALGTVANGLGVRLAYAVPDYVEGTLAELLDRASVSEGDSVLLARARFRVGNLEIDGDLVVFLSASSIEGLKSAAGRIARSESLG